VPAAPTFNTVRRETDASGAALKTLFNFDPLTIPQVGPPGICVPLLSLGTPKNDRVIFKIVAKFARSTNFLAWRGIVRSLCGSKSRRFDPRELQDWQKYGSHFGKSVICPANHRVFSETSPNPAPDDFTCVVGPANRALMGMFLISLNQFAGRLNLHRPSPINPRNEH